MKRSILAAFLAAGLLPANLQAQVWAPPQAHWTFNWLLPPETGYAELINVADVVIGGVPCQGLELSRHIFNSSANAFQIVYFGTMYTASNGDLATIHNGAGFDTLYWFGAVPGSHWTYPTNLDHPPGQLTVSDTGSAVVQGLLLRFLAVVLPNGAVDTIYERFGSRRYFLDQEFSFHAVAPITGLRCYSDTLIDLSTGTAGACDFILGTPDRTRDDQVSLWPDPGVGQFSVRTSSVNALVTVRDARGRIMYGPMRRTDQEPVTTASWPAGCYAITVETGDRRRTLRWIKQ